MKKRQGIYYGFIGLAIILSLCFSFNAFAGGSSGEGGAGANCGDGDFKYTGQPFIGTIILEYFDSGIFATGLVEKVGNSGYSGNFIGDNVVGATQIQWDSLSQQDIKGACLDVGVFDDGHVGFREVIGAGNLKVIDADSVSIHVVIMNLQQQF